ncbi:MAG: 6-phosphogluconolactonase, partial [Bdellovibrionota bacterium]
ADARVAAVLLEGDAVADVAILGLGLNGHVAFHEPGLGRDFFSGCVKLSDTTVGQLAAEPETWGITYGAGAFARCRSVCIMVGGASKRDVLKRLLAGDDSLPATALMKHPDLTIFADRAAHP